MMIVYIYIYIYIYIYTQMIGKLINLGTFLIRITTCDDSGKYKYYFGFKNIFLLFKKISKQY